MRLAVLADIHGNLPALEAVIADMTDRGIDAVINLGDCVSGPLWPRETLHRLRALGWPTVRGNHDRWVGGPGRALAASDAFAAAEIDDDGRAWLAALPPAIDGPAGCLAVHATPRDDNAYLTEDIVAGRLVPARPAEIARRLGATRAGLVLAAHSHLATVLRLEDARWIVNPGSVGCPAYHDPEAPAHVSESLSPSARYAVLDIDPTHPAGFVAALIALPYDHAAASRRADALNRPEWAYALAHGFMPAMGGPTGP